MLLPDNQIISLFLSGVKAPAVKRDPLPAAKDQLLDAAEQPAAAAASASAAPKSIAESEPFAEEAKFFVESRLLQRQVQVVLESTYKTAFVGSVLHPNGNIAEALLAGGFASCLDSTITGVHGGPQKLRDAEKYGLSFFPSSLVLNEIFHLFISI
jgi:staphylococcal nuclease domain-containing protein 1